MAEIDECAAAEILENRNSVVACKGHQAAEIDAGCKTDDPIITGVHFEEQTRTFADRLLVVRQVRSIRGPDFPEADAAFRHDVGDAERAANLDEFATRHHDLFAFCKRIQRDEERGGIIVDDRGGLRAGEVSRKLLNQCFSLPALTAGKVVFEVHVLPGSRQSASIAGEASSARPKFVWSTVPVPLTTRLIADRLFNSTCCTTRARMALSSRSRLSIDEPSRIACRRSASTRRHTAVTYTRLYRASRCPMMGY